MSYLQIFMYYSPTTMSMGSERRVLGSTGTAHWVLTLCLKTGVHSHEIPWCFRPSEDQTLTQFSQLIQVKGQIDITGAGIIRQAETYTEEIVRGSLIRNETLMERNEIYTEQLLNLWLQLFGTFRDKFPRWMRTQIRAISHKPFKIQC